MLQNERGAGLEDRVVAPCFGDVANLSRAANFSHVPKGVEAFHDIGKRTFQGRAHKTVASFEELHTHAGEQDRVGDAVFRERLNCSAQERRQVQRTHNTQTDTTDFPASKEYHG